MNKEDGCTEDGKVVSITYCVKGARTMYDLVRKRRKLEDKLYLKVRALKKKNPDYKLPHATSQDPPTFMQKILCAGSIPPEFLLSELDDLDTKIDNFQMSDKPKVGSRMFVTFDTELALDTACVKSYEVEGPTGKCPKVKQSCEASDLIYKNMAVGIWNRRGREFLGYLICFGLIFASLSFLIWLDTEKYDPRIAGYAVGVLNSFLKVRRLRRKAAMIYEICSLLLVTQFVAGILRVLVQRYRAASNVLGPAVLTHDQANGCSCH